MEVSPIESNNNLEPKPPKPQQIKYLDLELGDSLGGTYHSSNQAQQNGSNNSQLDTDNKVFSQSTATDFKTQRTNKELMLLNFLLMNISNGFRPTRSQVANVLYQNDIDTNSVNYWFRLFIERLIRNKTKKKGN